MILFLDDGEFDGIEEDDATNSTINEEERR